MVTAYPKIELHVHLEATVQPEMLLAIAKRNGQTLPADTVEGLRELARQYRWEAASDFRRAVDVYFRDFRPRLLETVNFRDYLARWA